MDSASENKKSLEWTPVHFVYDKNKFDIAGTHRPDFILSIRRIIYQIGIEVTGLYLHQASARLKNKLNYAAKVLAGRVIKEDKRHLRVESLIFNPNDQSRRFEMDAVLYNHPPINEFLGLLEATISEKARKYSNYNSSLNKLELVITDEESFFSSWNVEDVSKVIFKDLSLNRSIQANVFAEIYLVTNIDKDRVSCH